MSPHSIAVEAATQYAAMHGIEIRVSGLYDCFPSTKRQSSLAVAGSWPDNFPQHLERGVYFVLAENAGEPMVIYVGEVHGETRCFDTRLCDYFDMKAFRSTGECVLRDEWKGYKKPWTLLPRFIVTISVKADSDQILEMEKHLIQTLDPCQNSSHRQSTPVPTVSRVPISAETERQLIILAEKMSGEGGAR